MRRKRDHARTIASLRNNKNVLPSLYKTRQFGAPRRVFTSADGRRLLRAINGLKGARGGAKAVRRGLRAAESKLAVECEAKQELQQQLDVAKANRQKLNAQERRGYKTECEGAKRLRYIKESILPALRLAMADKPTKSKEHTLQLVRDHIRQVSCWIRECTLSACLLQHCKLNLREFPMEYFESTTNMIANNKVSQEELSPVSFYSLFHTHQHFRTNPSHEQFSI